MKKRVILLGLSLLVVLCTIAYGSQIPASYTSQEFKGLLINAVGDVIQGNNPKIATNEAKDLITAYILANGGPVLTGGTGLFSGETILHILDKYYGNNLGDTANGGVGAIPPGITVKTLTPSAIKVRYSCMCGSATESIAPGETKYYMINLTDWPAWQDAYLACKRTTIGYGGKTFPDDYMQKFMDDYRASTNKDKYVAQWGSYSQDTYYLGCNIYSSNFGCETNPGDSGIAVNMLTAMGYNKVPVFEEINKFHGLLFGWSYWMKVSNGPTSIDGAHPIAAANGTMNLAGGGASGVSNGQGNGENPLLGVPVYEVGAKEVYIMVHNEHSYNWDKPRNFLILMECPIASISGTNITSPAPNPPTPPNPVPPTPPVPPNPIPPTPNPGNCSNTAKDMSTQLASAVSLNFPVCTTMDKGKYGFMYQAVSNCDSSEYTVPKGGTTWFLADARALGWGSLQIPIADYAQMTTGGIIDAELYPIDENNCLYTPPNDPSKTRSYPAEIGLENNVGSSRPLNPASRYLIKIKEYGAAIPISIWMQQ